MSLSPGDYETIQTLSRCIDQINVWMLILHMEINNDLESKQ